MPFFSLLSEEKTTPELMVLCLGARVRFRSSVHATGAGAPVPQSLACMNAGCTCILMGGVCVRLALFLSCQLAVGRPEQCTSLTLLSSRQYDLHNTHILANRKWSCIYSTLQSCLLCLFSFCTSACMVNNHGKIAGNPLEQVYRYSIYTRRNKTC